MSFINSSKNKVKFQSTDSYLHVKKVSTKNNALYGCQNKKNTGIDNTFPHFFIAFSKLNNAFEDIWRDEDQKVVN